MAKLKTKPSDAAAHLKTERAVVNHLRAAFDDGDPMRVIHALKDVSRAKGIGPAARRLRMTQTALRAEILPRGKPRIRIVMKLLGTLGIKLTVAK